MSTPAISLSALGEKVTRVFYPDPDYTIEDFDEMRKILSDAVMYGYAATRLIHDDRITVTTYGASA